MEFVNKNKDDIDQSYRVQNYRVEVYMGHALLVLGDKGIKDQELHLSRI